MMRALAADALERFPALVAAHEIELRCVTPELRDRIPATRETLTSLAVPAERTRFYSRLRTLRIAHGLSEFLRDYAAAIGEPRSLVIDHVDHADQTDRELVSVLLRRLDPAVLTLVIGGGGAPGARTGRRASGDPLHAALTRYAHRHVGAGTRPPPPAAARRGRREPATAPRRKSSVGCPRRTSPGTASATTPNSRPPTSPSRQPSEAGCTTRARRS